LQIDRINQQNQQKRIFANLKKNIARRFSQMENTQIGEDEKTPQIFADLIE